MNTKTMGMEFGAGKVIKQHFERHKMQTLFKFGDLVRIVRHPSILIKDDAKANCRIERTNTSLLTIDVGKNNVLLIVGIFYKKNSNGCKATYVRLFTGTKFGCRWGGDLELV